MKSIIIGGGYIGNKLAAHSSKFGSTIWTTTSGKDASTRFNLEHPDEFNYSEICAGDTVFLAAAISAPDACQNNKCRARAINVDGTIRFAERAIEKGAHVIFFSSDTVYGEATEAFDETFVGRPVGIYAEMKREVELHFSGSQDFKSLRLSYVFSREDKFTKYLLNCSATDQAVEVFHPLGRAIVHRQDVIEGAFALALRWSDFPQPHLNFGGPTLLSRLDAVKVIQEVALPTLRYVVSEPPAEFFTTRPRNINMLSSQLPLLLGRPASSLREALQFEFQLKERV